MARSQVSTARAHRTLPAGLIRTVDWAASRPYLLERSEVGRDKRRLHALDRLLEQLEQLNLQDDATVPLWLQQRLVEAGVRPDIGATPAQVIDQIFALQEQYTARE